MGKAQGTAAVVGVFWAVLLEPQAAQLGRGGGVRCRQNASLRRAEGTRASLGRGTKKTNRKDPPAERNVEFSTATRAECSGHRRRVRADRDMREGSKILPLGS